MMSTCEKSLVSHSINEIKYISKSSIIESAQRLIDTDLKKFQWEWAQSGVRPQLYSLKSKRLLMDFEVIKGENSLHILNSISPAWTSSFALAKYYVNMVTL